MHWACLEGHIEIVGHLIDHGAEISPKDHLGGTPLHSASRKGFVDVAVRLCERGVEVSASDSLGGTLYILNPEPFTLNPKLQTSNPKHQGRLFTGRRCKATRQWWSSC